MYYKFNWKRSNVLWSRAGDIFLSVYFIKVHRITQAAGLNNCPTFSYT